jgi:hypothetical protein
MKPFERGLFGADSVGCRFVRRSISPPLVTRNGQTAEVFDRSAKRQHLPGSENHQYAPSIRLHQQPLSASGHDCPKPLSGNVAGRVNASSRAQDTPSLVSKARGEILDIILSTARPEWVIIGLANQIDSSSACPSEADWQLPVLCGGRFHLRR